MTRLDLPDGGWAEIADPKTVSERKRRPVMRASTDLYKYVGDLGGEMDGAAMDLAGVLNDAACAALVTAWSYEVPVTLDAILDLPGAVYDALRTGCAEYVEDLLPDFGVNPDAASPTEPSSA